MLGRLDPIPELLAHMPLAAQRRSVGLGFATAEALAGLGEAAEEAVLSAADRLPADQRFWHCYVAALGSRTASLEFRTTAGEAIGFADAASRVGARTAPSAQH